MGRKATYPAGVESGAAGLPGENSTYHWPHLARFFTMQHTIIGGAVLLKNVLFLKKIRILYFLPLLVIYALCSLPLPDASAATVTIAWDKNAETDVIGYTFHYGEYSHNYQYTVDVDNNTSCSISGLAEGTTYYFAVKAYNDKNLESSYSDELVYTIPNTPPPGEEGLDAHFDSNEDGFSYAPDTFNNTVKPNFSSGSYELNGGIEGGGLRVFLGPGSTGGATSGGWSQDFSVDQDGMAQVTLSFRLIMDQGYESNEFGEVILEIDGNRHGNDVNNSLVHVIGNGNGGDIDDTGWLTESFTVPLSAGDDHELVIGAYNNNATASDESVEVFIDDITVVIIPDTPPPPADTYTIAASAGGCGTISPPGTATVNHGANQAYAILPQDNCHIANVRVDGQSIGTPSTYTFANVTSSHTIVADFAVNNHTITASAGANGSISPQGAVFVENASSESFTITPGANYHVSAVVVDGISVGAVTNYTFDNITTDHTISASFATDTHTITASAGANGTIFPAGNIPVAHNADQTFNITPDENYHVTDIIVDGTAVAPSDSYTFSNVTGNHTITAVFEIDTPKPHEIIIDNGDEGTSFTGKWRISRLPNPYGANSLYSRDQGAHYTYRAPVYGTYTVLLWWTEHATQRSNSVPVEIFDGDTLLDTVYVNQKTNGGQWNVLGQYVFSGTARAVVISEGDGSTGVDALRFFR